jgi:hypothetical protein
MKRIFIMLLVIFISACGNGDSEGGKGGLRGASSNRAVDNGIQSANSLISQIPAPVDQAGRLPDIEALSGRLIAVQGNTDELSRRIGQGGVIGTGRFDGELPRGIADRVHPTTVKVSRSGRYLGYTAVDNRIWKMYVVDLNLFDGDPSLEEGDYAVEVWEAPHAFGFVDGWSPDENWVMLRPAPNVVISSNDGSTQYELGPVFAFWLTDNRVLAIQPEQAFLNDIDGPVVDSFIFDPATDTRTQIDPGFTVINPFRFEPSNIINLLEVHNIVIYDHDEAWEDQFGKPFVSVGEHVLNVRYSQFPTLTRTCSDIVITHEESSTTLYEDTEVFTVTDFQIDAGGNIIFLKWIMEDCGFTIDRLKGEIISVSSEGEATVLADDVFIGKAFDNLRASIGKKFDISPDGQYMVYISGGIQTFNTTINLVDLQTGESAPLVTWTSGNSEDFLIREAFSAIFWLPD